MNLNGDFCERFGIFCAVAVMVGYLGSLAYHNEFQSISIVILIGGPIMAGFIGYFLAIPAALASLALAFPILKGVDSLLGLLGVRWQGLQPKRDGWMSKYGEWIVFLFIIPGLFVVMKIIALLSFGSDSGYTCIPMGPCD